MTSPATDSPARAGSGATVDQLTVARQDHDAYAHALKAMADEGGIDYAPNAGSGGTADDWVNAAARTADDPRAWAPLDARGPGTDAYAADLRAEDLRARIGVQPA